MPDDADVVGALKFCDQSRLPNSFAFFEDLDRRQPLISKVSASWDIIPTKVFGDYERQSDFQRVAVREGLFRSFVITLERPSTVSRFLLNAGLNSFVQQLRNYRQVLQQWSTPFRAQGKLPDALPAYEEVIRQQPERTTDNLTILLVEDDEDTRFLMRLELERRGYRLIEAEDGEKAVELAQEEHPDIIFMDISLPRMDALEASRLIRNHDQMHAVPIIIVTAHQESAVRQEAKASGLDAYVTKPIDFDWLSELMTDLIA